MAQLRPPKKVLEDAQQCLAGGKGSMETLPTIIKRIIRDGVWKELEDKDEKPFSSFYDFVEYKLWWGLETQYSRLVEFCKDDAECYRLLLEHMPEAAEQRRPTKQEAEHKPDNIRLNQYGTSASHALKRLKRDNPELASKVIQGELSANAAAILAGFRKPSVTVQPTDPVKAAKNIREKLGNEFAQQLKNAL